jgi:uncharacterized protein YyaL (SSP411 family)
MIKVIVILTMFLITCQQPKTEGKNVNQSENHLANETSPYLLQHAANPVHWYPWGEEALQHALREDKPILLSIGYAACHWCHVMAQESFEDSTTASLMNDLFVCIKIDREERPDLDQIYMTFVQMTTGRGGWPLNVFLTPDLEPFFGGTYFPPMERYGRPSWQTVLQNVSHFYHKEKERLTKNLATIRDGFQQTMQESSGSKIPDSAFVSSIARQLASYYDPVYGGLGRAPKFPAVQALAFFLRYYHQTGEKSYLDMVAFSLRKMANGGIYDQLGGGFARYSVDVEWLVPHFEKMLYDNALMAPVYIDTYLLTNDSFYLTIAEEILNFVQRELRSPEGGFNSSLDADSEGEEGKYYVWDKAEIVDILGEETGAIFCHLFGVTESGNFKSKTILFKAENIQSTAEKFKISKSAVTSIISNAKKILLEQREKRIRPGLDDKVLTSWNGLLLTAYARAYQVSPSKTYENIIKTNISFLKNRLCQEGHLFRSYNKGKSKHNGFLDDYAYLIQGLLDAYEALFDPAHLDWAYQLLQYANHHFWDIDNHGYFYTEELQQNLLFRMKEGSDQSIPAASAVMLLNNLRFFSITAENELIIKAEQIIQKYSDTLFGNPYGYASYLQGLDFYLQRPKEILIVTNEEKPTELLKTIFNSYLPNKIVVLQQNETKPSLLASELLSGKISSNGRPTAYVCHNFTCSPPITSPAELKNLLHD